MFEINPKINIMVYSNYEQINQPKNHVIKC